MNLPDIELTAAKVHNAWWKQKAESGFHAPVNCQSNNRKSYDNASPLNKERFDDSLDQKLHKWCNRCNHNKRAI